METKEILKSKAICWECLWRIITDTPSSFGEGEYENICKLLAEVRNEYDLTVVESIIDSRAPGLRAAVINNYQATANHKYQAKQKMVKPLKLEGDYKIEF